MSQSSALAAKRGFRFQLAGVVVVAAFSVLSWFGWMGWDHEYQVDPSTGAQSGPYEAWQVAGCALSLLAVFAGALVAGVRPLLASAALTLSFTVAWTVQAAGSDDSGLYGVGAIMLLLGLSAATTLVSVVVRLLQDRRAGRSRS